MVDVNEVAENIYLIDAQMYSIPKWGSAYLINEEKKALVDTGPATSANTVLDGIKKVGVRPEDIDYIIVTHIHLDHAGGAGVLAGDMPRAQVVVHHKGSKHMVNPERLINSVIAAQGEEAMVRYGAVVPIETDRVKPVYDGDVIKLGESQLLQFIDAPGHAPHELCIHESRNNGIFTGDAAGIYVADEVSLPVTPPPNFDAELYINTLERLMKLKANMIYVAHFGISNKAQERLQLLIDKLRLWDDMVAEAVKEGRFDGVEERMMTQICAELEPVRETGSLHKYLTEFFAPLNIAGYMKYAREKHEVS